MGTNIDATGLSCPAPVLLVKDILEKETPKNLLVTVDNEASKENVSRFLSTKGYSVTTVEKDGSFELVATASGEMALEQSVAKTTTTTAVDVKIAVLIMTDTMGRGDDELGGKLMTNYIKTLSEMGPELWQLIFVNSGVKLTIKDSPVLKELRKYQDAGTTVLACGTCLDHFGLLAEKEVGETTNMLDIVTATQLADKVITIG